MFKLHTAHFRPKPKIIDSLVGSRTDARTRPVCPPLTNITKHTFVSVAERKINLPSRHETADGKRVTRMAFVALCVEPISRRHK